MIIFWNVYERIHSNFARTLHLGAIGTWGEFSSLNIQGWEPQLSVVLLS